MRAVGGEGDAGQRGGAVGVGLAAGEGVGGGWLGESGGEGPRDGAGDEEEEGGGGVHFVLGLVLLRLREPERKEVRIEGLERCEGGGLVMTYFCPRDYLELITAPISQGSQYITASLGRCKMAGWVPCTQLMMTWQTTSSFA